MRDSHTLTRFSGINTIDSPANVKPHYALDCNNVMGGADGQLWQARLTRLLVALEGRTSSLGVLDTSAMGNPPRLIVQQGGRLQYTDSPDCDTLTPITGTPDIINPGRLSYTQSASVLYFSSGTWGGKLFPNDPVYRRWGIAQAPPPTLLALSTAYIPGSITISRTAGVTTVTFDSAPVAFVGDPIYVDSDQWDPTFSGTFAVVTVAGAVLTYNQPGQPDVTSFTRAAYGPGLTAATGYQYRVSWGYRIAVGTGFRVHWGTASLPTATIGPLTAQSPTLYTPLPPDPQVNRIALWRNLDGGGDWYLDTIVDLPAAGDFPRRVAIADILTDELLEASAQTPPYDNGVSPNGKFTCPHLDRILMCGVAGDTEAVYYSGFDSINFGNPQESWPFYNRISIGQGQASPNAIGITRYGAAVFCRNKAMYLIRGTLNDITTSAVTSLSFSVTELPFQIGNYSHYSTQSTPLGTVFLSDSFNLMVFDGYDPPSEIAPVLSKILQSITPGSQDVVTSAYIANADRSWYILSLPVNGSLANNKTIILDLNSTEERNSGAWVTDYSIDHVVSILNLDGTLHLIAAQQGLDNTDAPDPAGLLTEIPLIYAPGDDVMPRAHWRAGYFGIKDEDGVDEWSYYKLFRFLRIASDAGFTVDVWLVDGDQYTFANPLIVRADQYMGGVYSINQKMRAASIDLIFPDDGAGDPLTTLTINWNFAGKR